MAGNDHTATGDPDVTLALALPARLTDGNATIAQASEVAGASPASPGDPAKARYAIVGHAGSGGMATVHVARDLELMRTVALKQLAGGGQAADDARLRFLREAQVTAQLDHPHIVPIHGLEVAPDGAPAYAMKFVEGRTLEALVADARAAAAEGRADESLSLPARLEHFLKVCDAVHYAHDKGVIHRDLKPANIMIGRHNEIYVMDWGICRLFRQPDAAADSAAVDRADPEGAAGGHDPAPAIDASGGHATQAGAVVGTPRYMSPEQAQGLSQRLGPASDQYALGLILQELATLEPAVDGATALDLLLAAASARRRPPLSWPDRRLLPAPLRAILARACAPAPERRYPDVRALADDLRRWLRGDAVQAMPDSVWQRAVRWVGRHRQQVLLLVLALFAAGAGSVAALLWRHEQALLAAQREEHRTRALVDAVARQADALQLRLLRLQGELDAFATAAAHLLAYGTPSERALHWSPDYRDPAARPADFGPHPGFAHAVSLQQGVWSHPPGVPRGAVQPQARLLAHLLPYRNQLFAQARETLGMGQGDSGVAALVVALPSGLCLHYPGSATLPLDHDSRQTAWYQRVLDAHGAVWGNPSLDPASGGVRLPLSETLRGADGSALGAASIELSLDYIVHHLLGARDAADGTTLLLDAEGRVLASERVLAQAAASDGDELRLEPFADPALRAALEQASLGAVDTDASGRAETLAFARIAPTGWVLLTRHPHGSGDARAAAGRVGPAARPVEM